MEHGVRTIAKMFFHDYWSVKVETSAASSSEARGTAATRDMLRRGTSCRPRSTTTKMMDPNFETGRCVDIGTVGTPLELCCTLEACRLLIFEERFWNQVIGTLSGVAYTVAQSVGSAQKKELWNTLDWVATVPERPIHERTRSQRLYMTIKSTQIKQTCKRSGNTA